MDHLLNLAKVAFNVAQALLHTYLTISATQGSKNTAQRLRVYERVDANTRIPQNHTYPVRRDSPKRRLLVSLATNSCTFTNLRFTLI